MEEFRPLVERMLLMPSEFVEGHLRKKYQPVAHIAHGWMLRCVRGASALVMLSDAGLDGEAPPLARSILKHHVALLWLLSEGGAITAPLRTTHNKEATKFREALRRTAKLPLNEAEFDAVIASTEHDDHGRDYFQAFAHRAAHYGLEQDLTAYQALVMESHATYQSAVVYYDPDEKAPLPVSRTEFDWLEFAACYLYRSLVAYGSIFVARPWRQELAGIKARLIAINPDWDGSLDDA